MSISVGIFLHFYSQASKINKGMEEANKRHCHKIEVCGTCKRDYNCLVNKCPEFGDECHYIEDNFNEFINTEINASKEDYFVDSLCGKNSPQYSEYEPPCQNDTKQLSTVFIVKTALFYIGLSFKIGYIFFPAAYFLGFIILLIPVCLGFFVGLWIHIKDLEKN